MRASTRFLAGGISSIVLAGLTAVPLAAPAAAAPAADRTSAVEAARVDRVPTPVLDWYRCYDWAQCTTVKLPLDYDKPNGAKTEIAVLRVPARDQANRIGSLFLNPGGPGGSGTSMALSSPYFVGEEIRDRFDLIGFDPRGVGASAQVKCFPDNRAQAPVMDGMLAPFPVGPEQEARFIDSARAFGEACSTTGKPLSGAMSTAEAARDMDVLRRAVGDDKLSYLGFSYGTALGHYYANMFPDRVRAITLDGVINPKSWVGSKATRETTVDDRLRSADGAWRALDEIFDRCDAAGPELCEYSGRLRSEFARVADRLRAEPLQLEDEAGPYTIGYAEFVGGMLSLLYSPYAGEDVAWWLSVMLYLLDPETPEAQRAQASQAALERLAELRSNRPGRDFPYDNGFEAFAGVICTDALHPRDAASWPAKAAESDRRAPYFGSAWNYGTVQCASNTWTVKDEDAYRGPFNKRTSAPILIVGNYWDPATNYDDAVSSARLVPNSRLLTSDNWGHTAFGTSACVTTAVEEYLLRGTLPARGTVCVGDLQPFQPEPEEEASRRGAATQPRTERPSTVLSEVVKADPPAAGEPKLLPPVVAPPVLVR